MLTAFADGSVLGERSGNAQPNVLALHGWGGTHDQMRSVVTGLDAIALDLPGFGASPEPPVQWGTSDYAKAVAPVLDECRKPLVLVGYSFGGRVAVQLACMFPESIAALVLTGVPLLRSAPARKPPLSYRAVRFANRVGVFSDERLEAEKRKRGSADYRAARGVMREVFVRVVNESYEDQLRQVTCPVEMVWGENDTEAPLSVANKAGEMFGHSRLTVVPGGSHWFISDDPEPVRAAIARCLHS